MQWVSTFASGASSLGRTRRLVGHPAESDPLSSGGKFGANSPHLLGNIEKGKSKKKFSREARHSFGLVVAAFPGANTHPLARENVIAAEEPKNRQHPVRSCCGWQIVISLSHRECNIVLSPG
jgi:hypothetical protein